MPSSPLQRSTEILQKAKQDILLELSGHEHEALSISIVSGLTSLINRLSFLGNNNKVETLGAGGGFSPITDFFGEAINTPVAVVKADLQAAPTEKETYQAKVNRLQQEFRTMPAESIIKSYMIPEDILVLRGVAKRAGLEDYEKGTINIDFIERIKSGLGNAEVSAIKEAEINAQLIAGNAAVNTTPPELDNVNDAEPVTRKKAK